MTGEFFIIEVNIAGEGEEPIWDYEQGFGGEDGERNLKIFLYDDVDYSYDDYDIRVRKVKITDGEILFQRSKFKGPDWDEFIKCRENYPKFDESLTVDEIIEWKNREAEARKRIRE